MYEMVHNSATNSRTGRPSADSNFDDDGLDMVPPTINFATGEICNAAKKKSRVDDDEDVEDEDGIDDNEDDVTANACQCEDHEMVPPTINWNDPRNKEAAGLGPRGGITGTRPGGRDVDDRQAMGNDKPYPSDEYDDDDDTEGLDMAPPRPVEMAAEEVRRENQRRLGL